MKAVMVEVPEALLEERRRTGADRWDEMWDGVLHMVPPPSGEHQYVGGELFGTVRPLAKARGLVPFYETGLFRPGTDADYRVPDHMYVRPERRTARGVDGRADLVVEIRSPGDETYEKFSFYADLEVQEVLVVHPEERRVELFQLRGGRYEPAHVDRDGAVRSEVLGATLSTVDGPRLRLAWDGGDAEI